MHAYIINFVIGVPEIVAFVYSMLRVSRMGHNGTLDRLEDASFEPSRAMLFDMYDSIVFSLFDLRSGHPRSR